MNTVCGDNRFEIIAKVREHLIKATNIEMQPKELKYADNVLFRLWQLGYFNSVEKISKLEERIAELEQEKCELLGLIQGKDKAIKDLEEIKRKVEFLQFLILNA
jgi:hypothetical protein